MAARLSGCQRRCSSPKLPRRPRVPGRLQSQLRSRRAQTPPSRSALPVRLPVKNSNLTDSDTPNYEEVAAT